MCFLRGILVLCHLWKPLTLFCAQKMDSTALPLHLPTSWGERSYQSSNPPAGDKWVASLWTMTQHLAPCPFFVMLWFALYTAVPTALAVAERLLSCHLWCTTLICYMSQCFLWMDNVCQCAAQYLYSTSLHICQWGCSPGGEDDSYLCVCVCYQMVHLVRRCGRRILTPPVMITV